jgi:hypothetical protein
MSNSTGPWSVIQGLKTVPCGLYYKYFTIVIYDHNDSGQYYKAKIMIIIDDTSQL